MARRMAWNCWTRLGADPRLFENHYSETALDTK